MTFHLGNLVNWMSQRQTLVALSTMESEISAMKESTSEAVYLQYLMSELTAETNQIPSPIQIYCDNNSACVTVNTQIKFGRTNHYTGRINFIRHHVFNAMIRVQHLETGRRTHQATDGKPFQESVRNLRNDLRLKGSVEIRALSLVQSPLIEDFPPLNTFLATVWPFLLSDWLARQSITCIQPTHNLSPSSDHSISSALVSSNNFCVPS